MNATSPAHETTGCTVDGHEALKRDPAAWAAPPCIGYLNTPADDEGPATRLELRNHSCGSTLAIEVPVDAVEPTGITESAA